MSHNFQQSKTYPIKTVVLGNYATGKTTLINRLTTGKIRPFTESTIGCAYFSLNALSDKGNKLQYQIWDTAGQEKYRALTELYYRSADIIIICFDVANRTSFQHTQMWLDLIHENCTNVDRLIILVANKDDLEWDIDKELVMTFVENNNLTLVITSSLENRGINELLNTLTKLSDIKLKDNIESFDKRNQPINIKPVSPTLWNKCCN